MSEIGFLVHVVAAIIGWLLGSHMAKCVSEQARNKALYVAIAALLLTMPVPPVVFETTLGVLVTYITATGLAAYLQLKKLIEPAG